MPSLIIDYSYIYFMKRLLLSCFVILCYCTTMNSQATFVDISPTFHSSNSHFLSEEMELSFDTSATLFVGVSMFHHEKTSGEITYRVKDKDQWSNWYYYKELKEYVKDGRRAYEAKPILASFDKIQFKSTIPLSTNFKFRFYFPDNRIKVETVQSRNLDCSLPDFCDRACWCSTCPVDTSPQITVPTHLIVHHSAGFNQSNNFASVVAYYWDLHVNTNGWDDIGYNWLIDPNGELYQGRPDNYQGAHFSCINENTVGICMIGDYTNVEPSAEAINTLVELLGYEAIEHDIDVLDASYHVTGDFVIENISGHRDGNDSANGCSSTVCPGDSFYPLLVNVRAQVNALECYQDAISNSSEVLTKEFTVYPNPFDDQLRIDIKLNPEDVLLLVDNLGRVCTKVNENQTMDTNHIDSGLYFLTLNGRVITKLIKHNSSY